VGKDIADFLTETVIYLSPPTEHEVTPIVTHDEGMDRLNQSIRQITGQLLDFNDDPEPLISVMVGPNNSSIWLGQLGVYTYPTTLTALAKVTSRLSHLTENERFLRALLGYWPA
jgi:hypothetical protein